MPKIFDSLSAIKADVADSRAQALKLAVEMCGRRGYMPSRGTWLCTANKGGQCSPRAEAECPTWDGTLAEIDALIKLVEEKYPDVTSIYIAGGYDWATSLQAYRDGDYDPWVAAWEVPVWVSDANVAANLRAGRNPDGSSKGVDEGEVATAGRF